MLEKSADAFRTISEAAEELDVPQHVLRFWETRFGQIKPMKRAGGRRYYRPGRSGIAQGHPQAPLQPRLYHSWRPSSSSRKRVRPMSVALAVAKSCRGRAISRVKAHQLPAQQKFAPRPGKAPLARDIGDGPKVIHKLSAHAI